MNIYKIWFTNPNPAKDQVPYGYTQAAYGHLTIDWASKSVEEAWAVMDDTKKKNPKMDYEIHVCVVADVLRSEDLL